MTCCNYKRAHQASTEQLKDLTYPEFFKWWQKKTRVMKIRKVKHSQLREIFLVWSVKQVAEFQLAQQIKIDAVNQLALALQLLTNDIVDDEVHLLILLRCMRQIGL